MSPKFYLSCCLLLICATAFGQAARSPFSSYGLGEQYGTALTNQQGMGGTGISNPQYWYINNLNPALLVFNRLTTFEVGVIGEQRTQTSTTNSLTEKSGSGNLNYLVLAIPIKLTKWSSSIGLMPFTRLNYQLKYQEVVGGDPTSTVDITESGSGGINQFYWSNGVALNRKISIGLKTTYLFSSAINEYSNVLSQINQVIIIPKVVERTFVSDFQFTPGISIHLDSISKKNYRLNFGLTYDFKANINGKFHQSVERYSASGLLDSITTISNQRGVITLPQSISGGISFGRGYRWTVALDGSYADYSQYRDMTRSNPYQKNNWRVAGGFEITPDPGSLSSYLKRATYRTGVSIENYPYLVNGNEVKDFGITFGLSLPVSRVSSLDFALKLGKKGDKALNTVEENYLKLYFGITFNDQWFIKRRFD